MHKDVTQKTQFGNPDDEALPLLKCVCGRTFSSWELVLSMYEDDPEIMPCCGRKLFFRQSIRILEVV